MMNKNIRSKKITKTAGFTIVELMIATAIFSVVLLLCATAIIQVGRMFYKSIIINRTQTTTRTVVDDVSQTIQFTSSSAGAYQHPAAVTINGVTVNVYCFGSVRYTYAEPARSLGANAGTQTPHILWKDRITGNTCVAANVTVNSPSNGQELLGGSMRLALFTVAPPATAAGIWEVKVIVAYGATDDLFVSGSNYQTCSSNSGSQFCGVSSITTNIIKRL